MIKLYAAFMYVGIKLKILLLLMVFPVFLLAQSIEEKQLSTYIHNNQFKTAANYYQTHQQAAYSTQCHKDMMRVCKEVGEPELAIVICKKELLKNPHDDFWHIREMQFLIYNRKPDAAAKKLPFIQEKDTDDFKEVYEMLLREQENWVEWASILVKQYHEGKKTNVLIDKLLFCFYKLKAGTLAQDWVREQNISPSPLQRFYLLGAQASKWMKWSNEVAKSAEERILYAQKALGYIDSALQIVAIDKADRTYLAYDKTLALIAAAKYDTALAYAKTIQQPQPDFVTVALAKAALETRKPADAERMYRKVLMKDTMNTEAINGLSFSLSDQEKHRSNLSFLQAIIHKQPVWVIQAETGNRIYNPLLQSVQVQLARSYSYAGYQDSAIQLANKEIANDPMNIGLYQVRGNIYAARGLYKRALDNYTLTQAGEKNNAGLLYNMSGSYLRQYQFNKYQHIVQTLQQTFLQSPETQRMNKEWKEFNGTEVYAGTNYANSEGPVQNGNGYGYYIQAYSRPIALYWRMVVNYDRDWVDIPEGQVMFSRYGAGFEYRRNNIELIATLTGNRYIEHNIGATFKAIVTPDDYQRIGFVAEKISSETPLRGVFFQVYADRIGADYSYRWNEKTTVAAAFNYFLFTDQNRRIAANTNIKQRIYTRPHFLINGIIGIYTSANTITNVAYFNPKNDFSTDIQLNTQHTIFRKFEFNYTHQLTLSASNYQQYNFRSGIIGNIKYEQNIDINYTKSIGWSIAKGQRLYDGVKEPFLFFEINFHGKF